MSVIQENNNDKNTIEKIKNNLSLNTDKFYVLKEFVFIYALYENLNDRDKFEDCLHFCFPMLSENVKFNDVLDGAQKRHNFPNWKEKINQIKNQDSSQTKSEEEILREFAKDLETMLNNSWYIEKIKDDNIKKETKKMIARNLLALFVALKNYASIKKDKNILSEVIDFKNLNNEIFRINESFIITYKDEGNEYKFIDENNENSTDIEECKVIYEKPKDIKNNNDNNPKPKYTKKRFYIGLALYLVLKSLIYLPFSSILLYRFIKLNQLIQSGVQFTNANKFAFIFSFNNSLNIALSSIAILSVAFSVINFSSMLSVEDKSTKSYLMKFFVTFTTLVIASTLSIIFLNQIFSYVLLAITISIVFCEISGLISLYNKRDKNNNEDEIHINILFGYFLDAIFLVVFLVLAPIVIIECVIQFIFNKIKGEPEKIENKTEKTTNNETPSNFLDLNKFLIDLSFGKEF